MNRPYLWDKHLDIKNDIYVGNALFNIEVKNGIVCINSWSRFDKFSVEAMKFMIKNVVNNDYVMIASSLVHLNDRLLNSYGLKYNSKEEFYYKGLSWEQEH